MENFILYILKINLLSAVCILLVIALSRLVKGRYSSQWKYIMWLLIVVFLLFPAWMFESKAIVQIKIPQKEFSQTAESPRITADNKVPASDNINNQPARDELKENQSQPVFSTIGILKGIFIIWMVGFGILAVFKIVTYRFSLIEIKRWGIPERNRTVLKMYRSVCSRRHIKSPPKLMINPKLHTPVLAGLTNTRLYLPDISYSEKELRLIFLHELSHYKRKDLWYKMLLLIVNTVYWFNPALYLMVGEAEKDIEYICDSRVITDCSREDRILYNKLLLKTAAAQSYIHYLSASLNDSTAAFKERILYMMKAKKLKKGIVPIMLMVFMLIISNSLVGCTMNPSEKTPKEDAAKPESSELNEPDNSEEAKKQEKPIEPIKPVDKNDSSESAQNPDEANTKETPEAAPDTESEQTENTSESQPDTADTPSEPSGVTAKVQLYEKNYFDGSKLAVHDENIVDGQYIADDYYELAINNVTDTSFDFTISHVDGQTGAGDVVFLTNTAVFTGDGTTAAFNGNDYTLSFSFPDDHSALPEVTDITVSGFSPIEGITFTNNSIPGHEFN